MDQERRIAIGSHIAPINPGKKYAIPIYEVNEIGDNLELTNDVFILDFVSGSFSGITMSQILNTIKHKLIYDYGGYNATESQQEIIDAVTELMNMIKEEKINRDQE